MKKLAPDYLLKRRLSVILKTAFSSISPWYRKSVRDEIIRMLKHTKFPYKVETIKGNGKEG